MVSDRSTLASFLICRSAPRLCALPLEHVAETMRALPIEPMPGMPPFLLGVSIIRGAVVPVVNLARLLGATANVQAARYVTLRLGDRQVAFAVERVIGVRELAAESIEDIPPLLCEADAGVVAAIATLDAELLLVLQAARLIPESVWDALDAHDKQRAQ